MRHRNRRLALAAALALILAGGAATLTGWLPNSSRFHVVAYFDNSNGLFHGDEVRILGVPVGAIESIEPQPNRAKVTFWIDSKYTVPADVKALILAPQLITSRAIQLTPPYTGGSKLANGAVIPESRTAVPVEWDDLRAQLEKLTDALQPTQPGGVSTLGAFVNTAADNLRGQGAHIRESITKLSEAFSVLGDHSNDIFSTIKNLSVLVSALHDSSDVLGELNRNLDAVTALLADDPNKVGKAVTDLNEVVGAATSFVADNREAMGITTDKLASISQAVHDSLDDLKQTLHVAPTAFQNFVNIYDPTHAALTGALPLTNFANPITFLCGAIQAASRLNNEQSAKLCVQYLAPIIKNRQYNFPPLGENLFVGATARPNELTYTEDWMRPDYVPRPPAGGENPNAPTPLQVSLPSNPGTTPPATDPAGGLKGMMIPGGGS